MIWVVDGSRLTRDLRRFLDGRSWLRAMGEGLYVTPFPDELFPRSWLDCGAPVLFDFEKATGLTEETVSVSRPLWCLLPCRALERAVVLTLSREYLCAGRTTTPSSFRHRR